MSNNVRSKLIDLPSYRKFDLKSEDFLSRSVRPHQSFNFTSKNRIRKQLEDIERRRKLHSYRPQTYRQRVSNTQMDLIDSRALSKSKAQFTATPAKMANQSARNRYIGSLGATGD